MSRGRFARKTLSSCYNNLMSVKAALSASRERDLKCASIFAVPGIRNPDDGYPPDIRRNSYD